MPEPSRDAGAVAPASDRPLAEVMVDIAIADTDRIFHYMIPAELEGLRPGSLVRVPFGRRRVAGYVIGLTEQADVPVQQLRPIEALLEPEPVLPGDLLALARWMSEYYLCRLVQALRVMVPPPARHGQARPRRRLFAQPAKPLPELAAAVDALAARAPKQAQALALLLEHWQTSKQPVATAEFAAGRGLNAAVFRSLAERGLITLTLQGQRRDPLAALTPEHDAPAPLQPLTPQQADALATIAECRGDPARHVVVLQGVTGSGKTEVYLHAIQQVLAEGGGAIVMVPEIALTPQLVARFHAALGETIAVLHSALSAGERYDEWQRIRRGEARVVIGARSAVFAPVRNLRLLVLDEEHAPSYKQEETPRYHARTVAIERARLAGATVVLGSATPSVETMFAVRQGAYAHAVLPERIGRRALPRVELVDMRALYRIGKRSLFSPALTEAMERHLAAGGQVLLFINRRGHSTVVLCRECGDVTSCPYCAVALTYHHRGAVLRCHYCDFRMPPPDRCRNCGGTAIHFYGTGTQRVELAAKEAFPQARVARMDADTTTRKGSHQRIYQAFRRGDIEILVGTQMIARGWDIPNVTLVGVVAADTALHMPDFRSAERTFELLVQVAGRAGRGTQPGEVIIQTHNPEHYALQAAAAADGESFYRTELAMRQTLGYPPFGRLVRLLISSRSAAVAEAAAGALAERIRAALDAGDFAEDVQLLGPSPAPLERVRGRARWHLVLKGQALEPLRRLARATVPDVEGAFFDREQTRIAIDVDPLSML